MQNHALQVGEELVIPGHIRLTILAVEEDKIVLGITAEPSDHRLGNPELLPRTPRCRSSIWYNTDAASQPEQTGTH